MNFFRSRDYLSPRADRYDKRARGVRRALSGSVERCRPRSFFTNTSEDERILRSPLLRHETNALSANHRGTVCKNDDHDDAVEDDSSQLSIARNHATATVRPSVPRRFRVVRERLGATRSERKLRASGIRNSRRRGRIRFSVVGSEHRERGELLLAPWKNRTRLASSSERAKRPTRVKTRTNRGEPRKGKVRASSNRGGKVDGLDVLNFSGYLRRHRATRSLEPDAASEIPAPEPLRRFFVSFFPSPDS